MVNVLLVVLVIAAALGLIVAVIAAIWGDSGVRVEESGSVPDTPEAALAATVSRLAPPLAQGGYRVVPQTDRFALMECRFRPWWAILLAVCLFPIGLLFLIVKTTHTLSIEAHPDGAGTRVAVTGRATKWARNIVHERIAVG